jgi:hypothetical protein
MSMMIDDSAGVKLIMGDKITNAFSIDALIMMCVTFEKYLMRIRKIDEKEKSKVLSRTRVSLFRTN